MTIELLTELAWKSFLCAGLTLALLFLAKNRSAAERSWIAHVGLLATLLLPLSVLAVPNWQVEAPAPIAQLGATIEPASPPSSISQSAIPTAASAAEPASLPPISDAIPLIYAIPAGLLVLLLVLAIARLQLLRRRAEVLVESSWAVALAAAQRRLGYKHGTALLVSSELRSPISWGVVRPIILLDERAASDAAQAEAIIAHELAHVASLDWAKLVAGRLATAIFWFNPLVWLLARQCHELCEEAVDDTVLRSAIRSTDYAGLLISAARHDNRAILTAANGVAGSGSLTRRIERVLDSSRRRVPATFGWAIACCAGALFLSGPVTAVTFGDKAPLELRLASHPGGVEQRMAQRRIILVASENRAVAGDARASNAPLSATPLTAQTGATRGDQTGRGSLIRSGILIEAMVEAARKGDLQATAQLLSTGVDPNAVLPGSGTPLIAAIRAGRMDMAQYLLSQGADARMAVRGDGTALIAAARAGREDLVGLLLSKGAPIDQAVPGDGNPLTAAAAAGKLEMVQFLLGRGADLERAIPGEENALIRASHRGHEDVVRLLISRGADVNRRVFGRTALGMAGAAGNERIRQILIQAGARH